MNIIKDIPELVEAKVISPEIAEKIEAYYRSKNGHSHNRLFIVFGILGAILVGLGIILIIAHNWDELPRATKTFIAFLPLVAGQILCGYTLVKKPESIAWRESSSVFLFFAVGASISLVSQIYNIPGNLSSFLLTWMLLCLPLVYIIKSSLVSLLYLVGITYYSAEIGYWTYPNKIPYEYWLLLGLIFPHYYLLYKNKPVSNFTTFHHWLFPLSIIAILGTLSTTSEELLLIVYMSLLGLYYLLGNTVYFNNQKRRNNGYLILGSLGTVLLLLGLSFDWFWKELREDRFYFSFLSAEFIVALILTISAAALLYKRNKTLEELKPIEPVFILFVFIFVLGMFVNFAAALINLLVLVVGILYIRDGARQNHLGILNYGLLIISALVICRFFDTNLTFVMRGILFVAVGIGFFVTNFWMLKKRKING